MLHMRMWSVSGVAAAMLFVGAAARADVVFSDTEFTSSNWALENVTLGTGGTSSASQVTGGNPGFARQLTTNVNASGGVVYALSRYGTSVATRYEPAVSGAITSVDFTIDYRFLSGDTVLGQSIGIGAKQGTVVYYAALGVTGITGAWGTQSSLGLTAASFISPAGGAPIDFSSTGAPIRFGFVVGNSAPSTASVNTAMYDNFSVTIHNVPAPASAAVLGLGGLLASRRRRAM